MNDRKSTHSLVSHDILTTVCTTQGQHDCQLFFIVLYQDHSKLSFYDIFEILFRNLYTSTIQIYIEK